MGLTLRAAAVELGISHVGLLKAFQKGRVPRDPDGSYDVEKCREALSKNSNPGKQKAARAQQRKHRANPDTDEVPNDAAKAPRPAEESDEPDPGESDDGSYNEACRQEKWESVRKRKLERRLREGELVESAQVRQAWGEMVSHTRSQALLVPAKIAPKVAMLTDPRDVQMVIEKEMRALLTSLSEYRPAHE